MLNNYYVYFHRRLDTGEVFYVGKGSGRRAFTKQGRNQYWRRVVKKAGYSVEMKAVNLPEKTAFLFEIFLITTLKKRGFNLCNLTTGGEGVSGFPCSDKKRQKLAEFHTGKVHSDETKAKLSAHHTGLKSSVETILKISSSKIGAKLGEETKKKISEAAILKYSNPVLKQLNFEQIKNITPDEDTHIFMSLTGGVFKGSRGEFCSEFNISRNEICKLFAKKPRISVKGWTLLERSVSP